MSIGRILLSSKTGLSLHERFSQLPAQTATDDDDQPSVQAVSVVRPGSNHFDNHGSSLRSQQAENRKLLAVLERKLAFNTALKLKKKSVQQRLGTGSVLSTKVGIRSRLALRNGRPLARGRSLSRGRSQSRGRSRSRSRSVGRNPLSRSSSMTSLNSFASNRNSRLGLRGRRRSLSRSRLRGRGGRRGAVPRRGRSRGGIAAARLTGISRQSRDRGIKRRGRGGRLGGRGGRARSRSRSVNPGRRGARRGRSRIRGGRGRGGRQVPPSKEQLDNELDQYMSVRSSSLTRMDTL